MKHMTKSEELKNKSDIYIQSLELKIDELELELDKKEQDLSKLFIGLTSFKMML